MEAKQHERSTQLVSRYEKLKSGSMPWHDLYQNLADYFAPRYGTITVERGEGDLLEEGLFEDVGQEAAEDFASGCTNYIIPPGEKWAKINPTGRNPSRFVKDYWGYVSDTLLSNMVESSFHLSGQEDFLMNAVFGVSAMTVQAGNRLPYNFDTLLPGTYQFEVDDEDMPDINYREYKWTVKQIKDRFGKEAMHRSMQELLQKDSGSIEKHPVLWITLPRETKMKGFSLPQNRPYAELWIDMTNKHELDEDGFYENPVIVNRMYRTSDSFRGYSLAMRALKKVRQTSQMEEDKMLAQELMNDPPWLATNDSNFSGINVPGGVSYYDASMDPRHRPAQADLKNAVHHTREEIMQKRDEVRKTFFADMFQAFADQPKQMTATEVLAIMEQKLVLFTPFFTRYTKEKLNRVLERCLKIGIREGQIEAPPPEVMLDGGNFKIEYSSRVALAIKLMENKNLLQLMDIAVPMIEVDPSIRHVIKWRDALRRFGDNLAIDPSLLNNEADIQALLDQESQFEGAMASAELLEKGASAVGKLPPGSVEQMTA